MREAKRVLPLLALAAGLSLAGVARAAHVEGAACLEQNNGTVSETTSHRGLICANDKWQDAASLPLIGMRIIHVVPKTNIVDKTFESSQFLGVKVVQQTSDGHGEITLVGRVIALNPDNTGHVVIDLTDMGRNIHAVANVPLDASTSIVIDKDGAEYRVKVRRLPS